MKVEKYEIPASTMARIEGAMRSKPSFRTAEIAAMVEAIANGAGDGDLLRRAYRVADRLITRERQSLVKVSLEGQRVRWGWKAAAP